MWWGLLSFLRIVHGFGKLAFALSTNHKCFCHWTVLNRHSCGRQTQDLIYGNIGEDYSTC